MPDGAFGVYNQPAEGDKNWSNQLRDGSNKLDICAQKATSQEKWKILTSAS
jgi:hypothetical protein